MAVHRRKMGGGAAAIVTEGGQPDTNTPDHTPSWSASLVRHKTNQNQLVYTNVPRCRSIPCDMNNLKMLEVCHELANAPERTRETEMASLDPRSNSGFPFSLQQSSPHRPSHLPLHRPAALPHFHAESHGRRRPTVRGVQKTPTSSRRPGAWRL